MAKKKNYFGHPELLSFLCLITRTKEERVREWELWGTQRWGFLSGSLGRACGGRTCCTNDFGDGRSLWEPVLAAAESLCWRGERAVLSPPAGSILPGSGGGSSVQSCAGCQRYMEGLTQCLSLPAEQQLCLLSVLPIWCLGKPSLRR